MFKHAITALCLSCGPLPRLEGPQVPLPGPEDVHEFDERKSLIHERARLSLREGAFIVAGQDGWDVEIGDGAKYGGIFLAVADCDVGRGILKGFSDSVLARHGQIVRWEPNPEEVGGKYGITSRDAALGVWFGLLFHVKRCGDPENVARQLWQAHREFLQRNKDNLGGGETENQLTDAMLYMRDIVTSTLDPSFKPSPKGKWEGSVIGNIIGTIATKGHCHSVDLSMLQLLMAGSVSQLTRNTICEVEGKLDLPLYAWYCGRKSLKEFLSGWDGGREYHHQVCPWQDRTSDPGFTNPGVDWLLAYAVAARHI